jgi:hypothetical protein
VPPRSIGMPGWRCCRPAPGRCPRARRSELPSAWLYGCALFAGDVVLLIVSIR